MDKIKGVLLNWAIETILKALKSEVNPERIKQWETALITLLRQAAKSQTPDFDWDDQLVEVLAAALQIP